MDWSVKELNPDTFGPETQTPGHPVFVDFWATWCPPCRMMDPLIHQLADEYQEQIFIRKLNTDMNRSVAKEFDVSAVPTFMIFKNGKVIWRMSGAVGKKKLKEVFSDVLDGRIA